MQKIAGLLAEDEEYPLDETLLFAQVDGSIMPSIYKNRGNHIISRWPDMNRLANAVLDLWYSYEPKERWAEIEYLIRDGRFHVRYVYPDEIDQTLVGCDKWDRREDAVRRYFGNKPIVEPDWPPPDEEDIDDMEA